MEKSSEKDTAKVGLVLSNGVVFYGDVIYYNEHGRTITLNNVYSMSFSSYSEALSAINSKYRITEHLSQSIYLCETAKLGLEFIESTIISTGREITPKLVIANFEIIVYFK